MSSSRFLLVAVVVAFSPATRAENLFVDNCTSPGEGQSFTSIQAAIDAAVDGDEVVVAPCAYFETVNFLGKAITLRSTAGPDVTIIDAQGAGTVITCDSGEGPDTVLDGFTIMGGAGFPGAGMVNIGSSPTVTNCRFTGNDAFSGGGMHNEAGSNPTVTGCTFDLNTANDGGGMSNQASSPTVTNCSFTGNETEFNFGRGGGMYNVSNSNPIVTACTFRANVTGLHGGGMSSNVDSNPIVTHCRFANNISNHGGGGLFTSLGSSGMVINCTFTGNLALSNGGGIENAAGSSPIVVNCTFDGNTAMQSGGGMFNFGSCPTVINCTFTQNSDGPGAGGGIFNDGFNSSVTLVVLNCVLWGNAQNQIREVGENSDTTVLYSNVQGGWPGTGNLDADPLFVDPGNGNLRLSPGSPSIDAGHNWAVAGLADTDLDGNPRFAADEIDFDPGCGLPVVVDMGAYELQGDPFPVTLGDIDGDGAVGIVDFLALLGDWGSCQNQCCLSDLDLDGNVGITDFLILLGNWG